MARAGLSRDAVVELALTVVDDGGPRGFENLTLAAVAARAGVAVPSLYKHIGGLPELRRAVALAAVEGLTAALRGAIDSVPAPAAQAAPPSTSGSSSALRAAADAIRAYAHATPGRYGATQGASWAHDPEATQIQDAASRTLVAVADALAPLQVPATHLVDAVRTVRAALHGFILLELDGGFGMPDDVDQSFRYLVDSLVAALSPR